MWTRVMTNVTLTSASDERWDRYLADAQADSERIKGIWCFKIEPAKAVTIARMALQRGDQDWPTRAKEAIAHRQNNIIDARGYQHKKLNEWIEKSNTQAGDALDALRELWFEGKRSPRDRVRAFDAKLPKEIGTRCTVASFFMMGINLEEFPPYQERAYHKAFGSVGYPKPPTKNVEDVYQHALGFLDIMVKESQKRKGNLRTRADAQSAIWHLRKD